MISNLAGNSIKYTPNDGEVRITVEGGDSRVLVSVADTGPGILPDYHEKIFEKFGQAEAGKERKKFSTGLGLAFCKLAVEAHGGKIWVNAKRGAGDQEGFVVFSVKDSGRGIAKEDQDKIFDKFVQVAAVSSMLWAEVFAKEKAVCGLTR